LDALLRSDVKRWEVVFERHEALLTALQARNSTLHVNADRIRMEVEGQQALQALLGEALGHGAVVHEVTPRHESLEQLFLRKALSDGVHE
jgi:ABC-2 type transport system ATP-binding protein